MVALLHAVAGGERALVFTQFSEMGEMLRRRLEERFAQAGVPLFPKRLKDLSTDCDCPDWTNPCKHVAAVYYLLAKAFDRDPFLLLELRGASRAALVAALGGGDATEAEESRPVRGRRARA